MESACSGNSIIWISPDWGTVGFLNKNMDHLRKGEINAR